LLATAATFSKNPPLLRGAVETTLQLVPSKCSANVVNPELDSMSPTAQISLPAIAAVPMS
jgi:hypothetical protein